MSPHTRILPPERLPSPSRVLARARSENFRVASPVLGHNWRSHLVAIYGFARLADEIGDSLAGDRLAALDWLEEELDRCRRGQAEDPLLRRLAITIESCGLPPEPFRNLIEANRRDQVVHRYETFDELLGYCQLSAAPVGRLVLAVFGADTPARLELSDRVCAGLQVIEHLQDVSEDAVAGRVYLPGEDLRRFGCPESALVGPCASEGLRRVVALEAERAEDLLASGAPLGRSLPLRARIAVFGFVAGGRATLAALRKADFDVLAHRVRPQRRKVLWKTVQLLWGAK